MNQFDTPLLFVIEKMVRVVVEGLEGSPKSGGQGADPQLRRLDGGVVAFDVSQQYFLTRDHKAIPSTGDQVEGRASFLQIGKGDR